MILQCDQCNTKFRLDDSKLKPGGVKVRCSKCRHVFVAGAEQKQEESEFDVLLSGLGAPAAAAAEAQAPAAEQVANDLAAVETGVKPQQPEESDGGLGDFDFSADVGEPLSPAPTQDTVVPEKAATAPGDDLDFGDLSFDTGTAAAEPPAPTAPEAEFGEFGDFDFNEETVSPPPKEQPAGEEMDFGEVSFDQEPAPAKEDQAAPAVADAFDFGEFSFDEETPLVKEESPAPAAADAFEFGEFSFDESASAAKEPQAPAAPDSLNFGDFSFEEGVGIPEPAAPAAAESLDFGELSFEETPSAAKEETAEPAGPHDFGEFSFDEQAPALREEKGAAAAESTMDFGEFSFEEEAGTPQPEAPASAAGSGFGELSFEEEAAPAEEKPAVAAATMDFGEFSFEDEAAGPKETAAKPVAPGQPSSAEPDEAFSFGELSFGEEAEPEPVPKQAAGPVAGAALTGATLAAAGKTEDAAPAAPAAAASGQAPKAAASPLDFHFGEQPPDVAPGEFAEDELPPLSIISRRKGRSAFTIAIVAISVIVVLALSAAGLYVLQSGPAALQKLDKMGIGFVAKWFGMEVPEEGRITIRNPLASFYQNHQAGELFVVTGEAVNSFRKARASIQVRVSLYDKSGKVLMQKTAYCGNRLSKEQLTTLPLEKLESIMNNQFGDSLSNLGVQPGQPIGFVVAIANVPKEAADFGVEVVGSTVAAGQ
uniref:MJ0042 family finger-like protein n=1 Tax=Geobacter sp. (strain M21) TaxID=443144 RepID=C6DZZ5_GEOSM